MNNRERCSLRDRNLLRLIESQTSMNTDQLKLLIFHDVSPRMAYKRLKRLTDIKLLGRDRYTLNDPYYYYLGVKPGQIEHVLGVSWVYTWINLKLSSWDKLHSFEREVTFKGMRSDGLIAIKNNVTNTLRFMFVELDIAESGNPFNKKKLYESLYHSDGYKGKWWSNLLTRFPPVIVVTTDKVEKIRERIGESEIEFRVYSLDGIKEECRNGSSSSSGFRT